MKTITATLPAWITNEFYDTQLLIDGEPSKAISGLSYYDHDMTGAGWVKCGEAEITLHVADANEIIGSKVDALRQEKSRVIAEAQRKETELDRKINELLAIEYKGE